MLSAALQGLLRLSNKKQQEMHFTIGQALACVATGESQGSSDDFHSLRGGDSTSTSDLPIEQKSKRARVDIPEVSFSLSLKFSDATADGEEKKADSKTKTRVCGHMVK